MGSFINVSLPMDRERLPTGEDLFDVLNEGVLIHLNREDNRDVNVDQVTIWIVLIPKRIDRRRVDLGKVD